MHCLSTKRLFVRLWSVQACCSLLSVNFVTFPFKFFSSGQALVLGTTVKLHALAPIQDWVPWVNLVILVPLVKTLSSVSVSMFKMYLSYKQLCLSTYHHRCSMNTNALQDILVPGTLPEFPAQLKILLCNVQSLTRSIQINSSLTSQVKATEQKLNPPSLGDLKTDYIFLLGIQLFTSLRNKSCSWHYFSHSCFPLLYLFTIL